VTGHDPSPAHAGAVSPLTGGFPHTRAIASNDYMRSFLRNLACYTPLAHDTFVHSLFEICMCVHVHWPA